MKTTIKQLRNRHKWNAVLLRPLKIAARLVCTHRMCWVCRYELWLSIFDSLLQFFVQVLLTSCLEIGSHCNPCWKYVFKCCQYIIELEHNYFTSRHSSLLTSTRASLSSFIKSNKSNDFDLNLPQINEVNSDISSMPGMNENENISFETSINDFVAQTASQSSDCILKVCIAL